MPSCLVIPLWPLRPCQDLIPAQIFLKDLIMAEESLTIKRSIENLVPQKPDLVADVSI